MPFYEKLVAIIGDRQKARDVLALICEELNVNLDMTTRLMPTVDEARALGLLEE